MKKRVFLLIIFVVIFLSAERGFCLQLNGEDSTIIYKRLNINNISTVFSNTGLSDFINPSKGEFKYPKDSNKVLCSSSSLYWGGNIDGEIRVSGAIYKETALRPTMGKNIYRVRRDYKTGDLTSELNDGEGSLEEIREEYSRNWNEWPAEKGAPFEDINENETYEPDIDIPGFPGADQTIWISVSDIDSSLAHDLYSSKPLGIELQATYWAYNSHKKSLKNTIFRKYKIINRSSKEITDMFCALDVDSDIGFIDDDLVGFDSTKQLGFAYNASENDMFYGNNPPALGCKLLQGPKVNNINMGLSAFNFFINVDPLYYYYLFPDNPSGVISTYYQFEGILKNGKKYIVPDDLGGGESSFPFTGNPVTGYGWLDGEVSGLQPGSRAMSLPTGPFDLAPSESQEITFAQIASGGGNGVSRLEAISLLKNYADEIQNFYDSLTSSLTGVIKNGFNLPKNFKLYQNYPNPFNPSTIIEYELPFVSYVELNIYNTLGEKVKTLVSKRQPLGKHKILFNASNLPSGVYVYQLISNGYSICRKLLLIK